MLWKQTTVEVDEKDDTRLKIYFLSTIVNLKQTKDITHLSGL